jgi:hypothetical protein
MFYLYKIINPDQDTTIDNIVFDKKIESLKKYTTKQYQYSKYSLMNNGWCYFNKILILDSLQDIVWKTKTHILVDLDSDKLVKDKLGRDLLQVIRDSKLLELLEC